MNRRVNNLKPILEVIALDAADAQAAEQGEPIGSSWYRL